MQVPTPPATPHTLSESVEGDIVGNDGNAYTVDEAYNGSFYNLPDGVTAVGVVVVKSESEGGSYVTALRRSTSTAIWDNRANCLTEIISVTGHSWIVGEKESYYSIFDRQNYTRALISSAGGEVDNSTKLWTNTESTPGTAYYFSVDRVSATPTSIDKTYFTLPIFQF